ncbi:MAG: UvrD-helicase domain-containing protein [Gammaproteobacteria bacterium]|nr:UvrD-helicase domain-containing protein [Gammaproteobacteria bacterium]MBU1653867.1 UvrD-helicase domain-containing protein [Gammaproteobacteria bacterium]MBU1962579.1 UvrD-helicase domain-containing protein [Gammaproteobacteria bacterium]
MNTTSQPLDPFTIPLTGTRLIEAGAGTGKTHAITSLYLRLLLELGLDLDRILVVTFTNAATGELRDRVRLRMGRLLDHLEGHETRDAGELAQFAARLPDRDQAIQRLRDSLVRLDEAAIFTIHGFCQRVLSDNALESGTLFESEFVTDDRALEQQVVEDFWRVQAATLSPPMADWLREQWDGPAALLRTLRDLLRHREGRLCLDTPSPLPLAATAQGAFQDLHTTWRGQGLKVVELLASAEGLSKDKRKGYTPDGIRDAQAALDHWFAGGLFLSLPKGFELFTSAKLAETTLKKKTPPQHPFFDRCQAYRELIEDTKRQLLARFLQQARDWCLEQLDARRERRRELTFDDLLWRLDQALGGPGGTALAARLRERHPAALIDEFQDTDGLQYRIFQRIFRTTEDNSALFMIGDPKQAIYSFRGADVFTYIRARRDMTSRDGLMSREAGSRERPTTDNRYTLTRNWRSAGRLVAGINRLFGNHPLPFLFEDIPYEPLSAAGCADAAPLTIDGQTDAPLRIWFLPRAEGKKDVPKNRAEPLIADACAAEIARLISLGEQGRALIGDRPLGPGDIALLVRNRFEAATLGQALRRLSVGSVFQSRDNVFDTEEARELALLLRALTAPSDGRALRAAAATSLLGATAREIHALLESTEDWETWHAVFDRGQRRWRGHGFMAMFMPLLHERGIPARLLRGEQGERRLTNLMHLAELLQNASRQEDSPERLTRWFADQRCRAIDGEADNEEQTLLLESDQRLVRIVTIHKSKGLEYPIVFLPYLYQAKEFKPKPPLPVHERDSGDLLFDLGSKGFDLHRGLADEERLAEETRLAYVALTRAQHRCYLPWGYINGVQHGALGRLLHPNDQGMRRLSPNDDHVASSLDRSLPPHGGGGKPALRDFHCMGMGDDASLLAELNVLAGDDGAIAIESLPLEGIGQPLSPDKAKSTPLIARPFRGNIERNWRITSYSGLIAGAVHSSGGTPSAERLAEVAATVESLTPAVIDSFPAGIQPGLFLHGLLERLDFPRARGDALRHEVERQLDLFGMDRGLCGAAEQLMANLLDSPLDPAETLLLRDLAADRRRAEMAFHYPLAEVSPAALDAMLQGLGNFTPEGGRLQFNPAKGLMIGFIDLVFEHQGRYYLADYKSNRLEDYGPAGLRAAMAAHRYDLQYLIYTVALHRYLATRLRDYGYERHFGGIYYLFPRGMSPEQGNGAGIFFDRPAFALVDGLDRLFGGSE